MVNWDEYVSFLTGEEPSVNPKILLYNWISLVNKEPFFGCLWSAVQAYFAQVKQIMLNCSTLFVRQTIISVETAAPHF